MSPMKLVALVRAPERLDEAADALAAATGLTRAESRMRLSPEPPALVARLPGPEADALAAALREAGLAALAIDAAVPGDAARTVAHRVAFSAERVTFTPRAGEALELPWAGVQAVLRGLREFRAETEKTEKTRKLSLARTVAMGGIPASVTSKQTVRASEGTFQQVILVFGRDGRAAALVEGQVDFACLGADLQPSSTANMAALARRLRDGAKGAFYDERLLRLGRRPLPFVTEGETRTVTKTAAVTRRDTTAALDVLAAVMREALAQGLLP